MPLRDIVSTNRYIKEINLARLVQDEATFYISTDVNNDHKWRFKERIKSIYAQDYYKYTRFFEAFAGDVMPSIELCETIYKQLYRVWDSQDRVREFNFRDSELNSEAVSYIERFNKWWLIDWWEAFKHQFCSFIVVDLPMTQNTFRPEPYPYIVNISDVLFVEKTDEGKVSRIIFRSFERSGDETLEYWYYYTGEIYSKYLMKDDQEIDIVNIPHNLGRCPVHKVWGEKYNNTSWILSRSSITPNFEDLFWYIVKTIESRKADLLYLNPDKQMPKISCGFDTSKGKHYSTLVRSPSKCVGGYLFSLDEDIPIFEDGRRVLCPMCGTRRHAGGGAGNLIEIDLDKPAIKDGKVNPSDTLVMYISPDIDGVKEQYKRVERLKETIIKQSVGSDEQPTKSAVNELQQTAIFESRENVLKGIAEGISFVRTEVEKDIFELRYGEQFVSNRYNQGTKFYLYKVEELLDVRQKASNPIQKRQIDEQILEIKFRNNQTRFNEEKLLYKLLPYNTLSDSEFMSLVEGGRVVDSDMIELRLQFSNAIELFESEFGSIIEFFDKFSDSFFEKDKIDVIRKYLLTNIKKNVQNQVS